MKPKLHIVVTGGHHNSALVVAGEFVEHGVQVSWLGHRQAAYGDKHDSAEYIEVVENKIRFYNLIAGKFTLSNGLVNLINIPLGIIRAGKLLHNLKPDAVLSFGGYIGFAVAFAAFFMRIPIYLHEQTVTSGLSNRVIAWLAKRIFLTWESSLAKFPNKAEVIGLPLREGIKSAKHVALFDRKLPTLLIVGGKQGSHVINELVFKHLADLLGSYNLVHQTGTNSITSDYEKALSLKEGLPEELGRYYQPFGYLGESEIGRYLASTTYYVGRSGAHITYELAVMGVPSLLIPYLLTHDYEQLQNARMLEKHGNCLILGESELSYPKFIRSLKSLKTLKPHPLKLPLDSGSNLVRIMLADLS